MPLVQSTAPKVENIAFEPGKSTPVHTKYKHSAFSYCLVDPRNDHNICTTNYLFFLDKPFPQISNFYFYILFSQFKNVYHLVSNSVSSNCLPALSRGQRVLNESTLWYNSQNLDLSQWSKYILHVVFLLKQHQPTWARIKNSSLTVCEVVTLCGMTSGWIVIRLWQTSRFHLWKPF